MHHICEIPRSTGASKIYIAGSNGTHQGLEACCACKIENIMYDPFCDDFGPMNLLSIVRFIKVLDQQIDDGCSDQIIFAVSEGPRAFTNVAFLLGAYMLLKLDMTPATVNACFADLDSALFEPYRDATYHPADFHLSLLDCWSGIHRAMGEGWLARPTQQCSSVWGRINIDEYAQYDDPLNADLHEVVPGKLVAMRTPRDLGGAAYRDARGGVRHFAPAFFVPIFGELGVSDVVQLNESCYDPAAFAAAGIAHHDLALGDGAVPPLAVVRAFLAAVEAAPGVVAVHCEAGLGRTGMLIAVYLMKHRGFTAREAMGWLRVMRPGSVLGDQQHYLLAVERRLEQQRAAAASAAALQAVGHPHRLSAAAADSEEAAAAAE